MNCGRMNILGPRRLAGKASLSAQPVPVVIVGNKAATAGASSNAPVYTKTVVDANDPVASGTWALVKSTNFLGVATFIAVLVALIVPFLVGRLERSARECERSQDKVDEAQEQGLRDNSARHQLITILRVFERNAAALAAMPRLPIRAVLTAMTPFLDRALAPDIAYALETDAKRKVYDALALAQQQLALSAEYQDMIDREKHELDSALLTATSTSREYKLLHERKASLEARKKSAAGVELAQINVQIDEITREGQDLEVSERYVQMIEFYENNKQRRLEAQNKVPIIQANLESVKHHLRGARAALGDHEEIPAPLPEGPLADAGAET